MKTAIAALAKEEDPYIDEWLDYHFRLDFDEIHLLQHGGWEYAGRGFQNSGSLVRHSIPHAVRQTDALNAWLDEWRDAFDWVLFSDIDEFVCLKNGDNDIKAFLERYDGFNGLCLNWRLFGNAGRAEDGDYRVVARFTRCARRLDPTVKQLVHCARAGADAHLESVHTVMVGRDTRRTIRVYPEIANASGLHCQERLGINMADLPECLETAYLAHYKCKTLGEYRKRLARNSHYFNICGTPADFALALGRYYDFNRNEAEELALRRFQETGRFVE